MNELQKTSKRAPPSPQSRQSSMTLETIRLHGLTSAERRNAAGANPSCPCFALSIVQSAFEVPLFMRQSVNVPKWK